MDDTEPDPILGRLTAGRDVLLDGEGAADRVNAAAQVLASAFHVVQVVAPPGGMTLSRMIGQLSGREGVEQDDAALEVGFRRLAGADQALPTVLLLDATNGVQRPVLRYLQQMGRSVPRLRLVVAASPAVIATLAEPDMARLRARLDRLPEREPAPMPPLLPVPASWAIEPRPIPLRPRSASRRPLTWAACGLGLAASVAFGVWLGHAGSTVTETRLPSRQAALTPHPAPASVAAPVLAEAAPDPAPAHAPAPAPAVLPPPMPSQMAPIEKSTQIDPPPVALASAGPVAPMLRAPDPRSPATRPHSAARLRPQDPISRAAPSYASSEPDDIERDDNGYGRYGRFAPRGARFDPRVDDSFIGTFATGPYGARVFRYGP